MKVGDKVECNFGGSTWYKGIIEGTSPLGCWVFFSEDAKRDRVGNDGQGHWNLTSGDQGCEWRPLKEDKMESKTLTWSRVEEAKKLIGKRVKLSAVGKHKYTQGPRNPPDVSGNVTEVGPVGSAVWLRVDWDNKEHNSYESGTLEETMTAKQTAWAKVIEQFSKEDHFDCGPSDVIECKGCIFLKDGERCAVMSRTELTNIKQISPAAYETYKKDVIAKAEEFMKEDPIRKESIEKSVKHWEENTTLTKDLLKQINEFPMGDRDCALCQKYKHMAACGDCPLAQSGQACVNASSVYADVCRSRSAVANALSDFKRSCNNMLEKLKSLK